MVVSTKSCARSMKTETLLHEWVVAPTSIMILRGQEETASVRQARPHLRSPALSLPLRGGGRETLGSPPSSSLRSVKSGLGIGKGWADSLGEFQTLMGVQLSDLYPSPSFCHLLTGPLHGPGTTDP